MLAQAAAANVALPKEQATLQKAAGRVLAEPILADRDYPPVSRSVRDGFAVRASDVPGELTVIGEVRAGEAFQGELQPGQAVEIMTGAPLPRGADSVVMVEHVTVNGDQVNVPRSLAPNENVSLIGCQASLGAVLLEPGSPFGFCADRAACHGRRLQRVRIRAAPNSDPRDRRRNRGSKPDAARLSGSQLKCRVLGRSGGPRRRRSRNPARRPRPLCRHPRVDRARAAVRHADALRRRFGRKIRYRGACSGRPRRRSSFSIACSSCRASRSCLAKPKGNSSSACRGIPLPPW